jgi:nucleoside-diphosphate-sugar epimerase
MRRIRNMAKTRILLTGADTSTGSHILDQLLAYDGVSVRAVVSSQEAANTLHQQYRRSAASALDVVIVPERGHQMPASFDHALRDLSEPFYAIVHTPSSNILDEADCLARFINFETETTTSFLASVHEVASAVRRVVIVSSLTPFAQWLIDPHVDKGSSKAVSSQSHSVVDFENILATSQASNNIVNDAVMKWMRDSGVSFEVTYVTAPSVYGPAVHPLETSSDLTETNRRIWNICSSEPQERTETPPYGITHFADVRVRLPTVRTDSTELTFSTRTLPTLVFAQSSTIEPPARGSLFRRALCPLASKSHSTSSPGFLS